MFPHIVERHKRFLIRKWSFGWLYFDDNDRGWWKTCYTSYETKEKAREAYKNNKDKFRGFI